jgi:hypothetical protein
MWIEGWEDLLNEKGIWCPAAQHQGDCSLLLASPASVSLDEWKAASDGCGGCVLLSALILASRSVGQPPGNEDSRFRNVPLTACGFCISSQRRTGCHGNRGARSASWLLPRVGGSRWAGCTADWLSPCGGHLVLNDFWLSWDSSFHPHRNVRAHLWPSCSPPPQPPPPCSEPLRLCSAWAPVLARLPVGLLQQELWSVCFFLKWG